MLARSLTPSILEALAVHPVVFLGGARQTGKTTLVRELARSAYTATYVTLDDAATLNAARSDPTGFVAGQSGAVIIDEVQRAPDLFLAIKASVDRDRRPGRYLLTGSANILLVPGIADYLAGRMRIVTLWPLSQSEIDGRSSAYVDRLYEAPLPGHGDVPVDAGDLARRILRGGFPEVVGMEREESRREWFRAYATTIVQREVRDIAAVEGLTMLPNLLSLMASRLTGMLNHADLARTLGAPQSTLKRYVALLIATHVVQLLPAWHVDCGKRLAKAPKIILSDTGLAAHLVAAREERALADRGLLGPLLENFVVMEVRKQIERSRFRPELYHFRTHEGQEVDLVLDDPEGGIVGIEVKAAATLGPGDFAGLRTLAGAAGSRFRGGVVLYTGSQVVSFGENLRAVPVSALWTW